MRSILLLLHLLGAIVWIGGMFFAHFCLRPSALETLQPPQRLPLWAATLGRFLDYTGIAVIAILLSGIALLAQADVSAAPAGWHAMAVIGVVMAGVYAYIRFALYPRFRARSDGAQWPDAAAVLNRIRLLVTVNLGLGVCTVLAAVAAR